MSKNTKMRTGNFDVFEQLSDLINRERSKIPEKAKLIKQILNNYTIIESELDKILHVNPKIGKEFSIAVEGGLGMLADVAEIKGIEDENSLYNILIFSEYIKFLFTNSVLVNEIEYVRKNFYVNFPFLRFKEEISLLEEQKANFEERLSPCDKLIVSFQSSISKAGIPISKITFCDSYTAKFIKWDFKINQFKIVETKFFLDIIIKVGDSKSSNVSDLLKPIYLFAAALEKIDDVKTSLLKIEKGSLIAHLFVWADEALAREEVKIVLDNTQSSLYKKVSQKFRQIEMEIEEKLRILTNKPTKKSRRAAESLDFELKKIQLIKERLSAITKVSEILTEAFIETDNIDLNVNGVDFIKIINGKIYITGANINQITE